MTDDKKLECILSHLIEFASGYPWGISIRL